MNQDDLHYSLIKTIEKHYPERTKSLLDKGADVNGVGKTGGTPLMAAEFCGVPEMVELLIERGARVDVVDHYGLTALHNPFRLDQAANAKCVQLLIAQGADVNARNAKGQTPLWMAVDVSLQSWEDNSLSIHALLDAGADIFIADHQGKTPYDLLRESKDNGWSGESVVARINAIHDQARMKQDTVEPPISSRPAVRI